MKEHLNGQWERRSILNIVYMNTGSCWKCVLHPQEQSATLYSDLARSSTSDL
jgi:hypothetical protein